MEFEQAIAECLGGKFGDADMKRAELYAEKYHLNLHYVDIDWSVVERNLPVLMRRKGAPVHSIEPQIMEGGLQAKKDCVEMMVAADGSDLVFGGMDKMLSKEWTFDEWVEFYTFLDPARVLKELPPPKPGQAKKALWEAASKL